MIYTPESIRIERAILKDMSPGAPRTDEARRNLVGKYINALDEIERLADLSGELYILALRHNKELANQIVARFARNS